MLLSPSVICCVAVALMTVESRKSTKPKPASLGKENTKHSGLNSLGKERTVSREFVHSSNNKPSKEEIKTSTLPDASNQPENVKLSTKKLKVRHSRRKTSLKLSTGAHVLGGITTQRPKPAMRRPKSNPGVNLSTDYTMDEMFRSDPTFFNLMDEALGDADEAERRKEEILKKFQGNATGRFKQWPFPFTEDTYIHEFDTAKRDMIRHWKNATRDFTELRREYAPESRSLHVAEMFTAFRRQGTRFYTVLGVEGWDGNIFEYPDVPYKYKDNPGSSHSVKSEECMTRDPRVLKFTEGESRWTFEPRINLGRYGEWIMDFPNETKIPDGPYTMHWPYKFRERDPDNMTMLINDFPTFARRRKRRGVTAVVRSRRFRV
uniref:Uncharacterized protein n=1 Tax=Cacopsylla melanoneura TaxID=428564 RepID=A0A8D8TAJ8_9HEMI